MLKDRGFIRDLLAKAREVGCTTLVFTVDMPVAGSRYRDVRSGLSGAPSLARLARRYWQAALRPGWAWDVGVNGRPHALGNVAPLLANQSGDGSPGIDDFFGWMRENFDPSTT